MTLVQAQVEDDVRSSVEAVLSQEGMSLTEAFTYFLQRTAQEQAIPSEVFRPNAESIEAMEEARRGGLRSYSNVEELMADLNAED